MPAADCSPRRRASLPQRSCDPVEWRRSARATVPPISAKPVRSSLGWRQRFHHLREYSHICGSTPMFARWEFIRFAALGRFIRLFKSSWAFLCSGVRVFAGDSGIFPAPPGHFPERKGWFRHGFAFASTIGMRSDQLYPGSSRGHGSDAAKPSPSPGPALETVPHVSIVCLASALSSHVGLASNGLRTPVAPICVT